jgi:predicted ABC-type ATPase
MCINHAGCFNNGKFSAFYSPRCCKSAADLKPLIVNADEIAKGLSPFQPETISLEAGRIMLERIKDLL